VRLGVRGCEWVGVYMCVYMYVGGVGVRAVMMKMWMISDTCCVCVYCTYACMYIHSVCVLMCVCTVLMYVCIYDDLG